MQAAASSIDGMGTPLFVPVLFLPWSEICGCLALTSLAACSQRLRKDGIGGKKMVARVRTVAFQGIEAVPVDVQVMIAPGKVGIQMVRWINFISLAQFRRR
ncbi:MAG: hypothetical protein EOS78_26675 [Mesorhizobium sp.]|nr:MAG: hypothetical protein EOS78_26675 [Mesorhizobium sp.]